MSDAAPSPLPAATLSDRPGAPVTLSRAGYDHDWFPWRTPAERPPARFPGDARTAVSVVVELSAVEWEDPLSPPHPAPPGGRGLGPAPDVPRMSHREFGHRVGIFRLLDQLATAGITPVAVVDALTAEHYRPLVEHLLPRVGEVIAGGLSASRPITSIMSEPEERDYIARSLDRLEAAIETRPVGWLGPERSESVRTPGLLGDAGVEYVLDWDNDELPYSMPGAGTWSFPVSWELSDLSCALHRQMSPWTWADAVIEAFDVLHAEGGRLFALHLQPWLSGQAFRAESVQRVLDHVAAAREVWHASPSEIVAHCRSQAGAAATGAI